MLGVSDLYSQLPAYPLSDSLFRATAVITSTSFRHLHVFNRSPLPCSGFPGPTVLWVKLTSARSTATFRCRLLLWHSFDASCREHTVQTSPGKSNNFPPMQPPHLPHGIRAALDFVLCGTLIHSCTAFVCGFCSSVRDFARQSFSPFDIRLPSDSTLRWTPLPSANASCCRARSGLSPPSCCPCRAHHHHENNRRPVLWSRLSFSYG